MDSSHTGDKSADEYPYKFSRIYSLEFISNIAHVASTH